MRGYPSLMAAAAALILATPAEAKWREASSEHFIIYSEDSQEALRKFATRLERYDGAMRFLRGVPAFNRGPANRLTIYVVSSIGAVQRLEGGGNNSVAGFYLPRATGSIAVIPRRAGTGSKWDLDAEIVLLHEYAHHFFFQNYSAAFPAWFSEGYAEFHSTAKFEDNGAVGLGLPAQHRSLGLLINGNLFSVEQMMAMGTERLPPEQTEALYGRGWLLTHYLTFEPSRDGQLGKYLEGLNSGRKGVEAATAAFGDLKKLDRELDAYLKHRKMSYLRIDASAIRLGSIAIRDLDPGEDALMGVKIRSRRGVDEKQAKALLTEVRRLAAPFADNVGVQLTLAEAEYDAGNYKEAETAADRALKVNPKATDALIYKGRARMELADASDDKDGWKEARRWLAAANRSDPDDPEPLILFYGSFGRQGIDPTPNAVSGLDRAFELAPQDPALRMQVAFQFLTDGKPKEARAALAPIAFNPHGGEGSTIVASIMAKIDQGDAAAALRVWSDAENAAK